MAWYQVPNNGLMGRLGRFIGRAEYPDDEVSIDTVAVDGFDELRAYIDRDGTSYYAHDRRFPHEDVFVCRNGTERHAIEEWRRMLREGEI
mgnify:CR=1 FL=1